MVHTTAHVGQEVVDDFGLLPSEAHLITELFVLQLAVVDEVLVGSVVVQLVQVFP